jgi:hypothetical protein
MYCHTTLGHGNYFGMRGILIPCACPPDRQTFINNFIANVAVGYAIHNPSVAISFPTDNTAEQDPRARDRSLQAR